LAPGGIDGRYGKVNAMIPLEDGVEKDGGSSFCGVCVGVASHLLLGDLGRHLVF
jgi:hypothetical protein